MCYFYFHFIIFNKNCFHSVFIYNQIFVPHNMLMLISLCVFFLLFNVAASSKAVIECLYVP